MAQYLHGQTGGHMRSVVKSWRGIHCPLSKESLRPETWDVFAARHEANFNALEGKSHQKGMDQSSMNE